MKFILVSICFYYLLSTVYCSSVVNKRPIIGILAQELSSYMGSKYTDVYESYITASYVKFVEGAGARAAPIWIGRNQSYYEDILSKVNGVLWPGGASYFNRTKGYADAAYKIYKVANEMNKKGDYFPILGICLGFEALTYLAASRVDHRIQCNSNKQTIPLQFEPGYRNSRMFGEAPHEVIQILEHENVTANYHMYCVTKKALKRAHLKDDFKVLSVNQDENGIEFISALEHTRRPFYGLQFHPEKDIYEWATNRNIAHGEHAVKAARYFADFFVNEARKNHHAFPSQREELSSLIYNYPVKFTALQGLVYMQTYFFR